ncbi:MAG: EF-hand domain-containing protein [Verrucomicrobiales bacterium]
MKLRLTLLTALAFIGSLAAVQAQDPGTTVRPPKGLPPALQGFDLDGDGKLSVEEWRAYVEANRPDRPAYPVDADGDGIITEAEIEDHRALIRQHVEEQRLKRFIEADIDQDEFLSSEEFLKTLPRNVSSETAQRLFDHCDADDDGKISKDEFLNCLGRGERPRPPKPPKPPRPPRPPQTPESRPLPEYLKPFDLDNSGILTRDEIADAIAKGTWPPTREGTRR